MDLAVFDFDGTLTTRATMSDFMHASVPPLRRALGVPLFVPMLVGYKLGLVSGTRICDAIVAFGFRHVSVAHVEAAGARFAAEFLPAVLRSEAMQRLAWHQSRGDTVALVSGGLDVYLAPWRRQQGIELICSRLESRSGLLTGHYLGAQCVGEEKARRIRERFDLSAYEQCHAYGDSDEDLAMLALAQQRTYRGCPMA